MIAAFAQGSSNLRRPRGGGFTLVEMITAMSISTILLAGAVSTVMLAGKAVPTSTDPSTSAMTAGRIVDQIAGEMETATFILQLTPTSITFTVPPRNGDAAPERISYRWAGTSGSPLMRQYNNGSAVSVIDQVNSFSLTPVAASSTESYPGVATEDATDSLLIDYSGTSSLTTQSVNTTAFFGQYFASSTWPASVVGWRPTRVSLNAEQASLLGGSTYVQLRPALSNFTPSATVWQQYTLAGSGLLASYAWQQYSFTGIDRFAPTAGVCLVLQGVSGVGNTLNVQSNTGTGLLQSTNTGASWSYGGALSMQSQMYGKLTRSGTTQCAASYYLSALQIGLRSGPGTNSMVTTTAQAMNHPEELSGYWELKFNADPTSLDVNGDRLADWVVAGGGTFNTATLANGAWSANGVGLNSNPGDNFAKLTYIDLRFSATTSGSWAGFSVNAARSGTTCAPIMAQITMQSDGTQTISVWRKLNDSTTDTLLTVPGLAAQPTDLHLVIDPAYASVAISINGVEYGSFAYNAYTSSDSTTFAALSSSGSAQFSYVRIRERLN